MSDDHVHFSRFIYKEKQYHSIQGGELGDLSIEVDGIEIIEQYYDESSYANFRIITDEKAEVTTIKQDMQKYYDIITQSFENEKVRGCFISLEDKESELLLHFKYSRERYEQISRDMGQDFFKNHIKKKGLDVLHNADEYWVSEELEKNLFQ